MEHLLALGKHTFLLEAPIEILHEESLEWLEEIEFWKDEITFFFRLMLTKNTQKPKTKMALDIESQLIYLSSEKLDDLKLSVQSHERFLSEMIKTVKWLDESVYRSKHRNLSKKFQLFEIEMKKLKTKIFQLVENSSKEEFLLENTK